ncbi:signal transducer CD24 [Paroedura picta]|uniref:signal transducer CD24 n=1 Tax=Paroedura picta TaxID=143630 RepID=UPI00405753F3
MGTALAARLGLGLLLLALLLPTQTGGDNSTAATPLLSNSSSTSSVPLSTLNNTSANTTKGHGNALQASAGLFIISLSLLYIC